MPLPRSCTRCCLVGWQSASTGGSTLATKPSPSPYWTYMDLRSSWRLISLSNVYSADATELCLLTPPLFMCFLSLPSRSYRWTVLSSCASTTPMKLCSSSLTGSSSRRSRSGKLWSNTFIFSYRGWIWAQKTSELKPVFYIALIFSWPYKHVNI